ncbi:phytoene desaturase family protein [Streptomyces qinzhouensis]|uniref:NAD(P)/FAD-dependent oxidoreductase n=1 Tax=Streptomyces qinzhouensis TaxID=2599401 RepID=A0A5B8IE23_9ACTN|nr:NAD(P)/FAD-dependent oxidoreductase [Streptomyces qinzhouensis]QDY76342.1 NAD(P)/FAD-dependent oxidoreductase [Streptomyces qinzhouensis]
MARIAVIGAGMGAMAAAARLAVAGHRVTVYERSATYGGALGVLERDGFTFDTGPGLLHLPAVWRDLFLKTGKEPLEDCLGLVPVSPASRHLFADGTAVVLPDASRAGIVSALDGALGAGAGERWGDFLGRARDAWDRSRRPLLEEPLRSDWRVLERDPYPALRRRAFLRSRRASTVAEVGARELADPRLATLFSWYALAYGLDPRHAPAGAAVLPYLEQTFGTWYVAGGLRQLARAVHERCRKRRVEFAFGSEVVSITVRDGRAAGIVLGDGTAVEADHVVAGADTAALLTEGPAGPAQPLRSDGDVPLRAEVPPGRFTVLLALRGAAGAGVAHRSVVHSPDASAEAAAVFGGAVTDRPTVTVLRPRDPLTRPDDGHEAVTLTATVAGHRVPGAPGTGPDWTDKALRERVAETLIDTVAAADPDFGGPDALRERLLWQEVLTPAETGALPAPSLAGPAGRWLHPSNSTRLPGLYLVGGRAHPGGGLAHEGMSGALVAGLIVEGAGFRGSQ